ncbi:MAG: oleate hydratase, partial [Methanomassiliicoccales archaeon]
MNPSTNPKAYLVGGGIASLSAAVYLIRDAGMRGSDITIFDESERMGGSLDAMDLSSSEGYSMRGIRMFEEKAYDCLFDLMSSIPSLAHPGQTLREEFLDFVRVNKSYSKARLLKHGQAIDGRPLQLSLRDRLAMLRLLVTRESSIEDRDIRSFFSPAFLSSNFWYEFCTVFAFEPWHSLIEFRRYFLRFIQSFPTIDTLESIESSPYNQYESLVLPVMNWLRNQGVSFVPRTKVVDIGFSENGETRTANLIRLERDGKSSDISL